MGANESTQTLSAEQAAMLERAQVVHPTPESLKYAEDAPLEPTVEDVEGVPGAFVIDNFLTPEECAAIIETTEAMQYTDAPITTASGPVMMKDVRTNKRCMMEASPEHLAIWEKRVRHLLPAEVFDGNWTLSPSCFNERLRFYRYEAGEAFNPHFDGCFRRSYEEQSHLTFIVYLNEGFEGGATTFYPNGLVSFHTTSDTKTPVAITPKAGRALIFYHTGRNSPFHEGSVHFTEGMCKYAVRSDIMYTKVPPQLDVVGEPTPAEAAGGDDTESLSVDVDDV